MRGQIAAEELDVAAVVVVDDVLVGAVLGVVVPELQPASSNAPEAPHKSHHRRRRVALAAALHRRDRAGRAGRARRAGLGGRQPVVMGAILGLRSLRVGDAARPGAP